MIRFLLITEGSSDAKLLSVLEMLCLECGAENVRGTYADLSRFPHVGHSLPDKLTGALKYESNFNLVFIHRDADASDDAPRRAEIEQAATEVGLSLPHVPVVPIHMTEAWLLADVEAIRKAADNPRGRAALNLPALQDIQGVRDPKSLLKQALCMASELSGRKLDKFQKAFGRKRALLLDSLRCDGLHASLPAWQRLKRDTAAAIARVTA